MNVVDSSGWLEYFADEANADFFAAAVEETEALLVPTISLYEVFKRMHQQLGEQKALEAVITMRQGTVVDLTPELAVAAAKTSIEQKLPMADAIVLATARAHGATLWTQDIDFAGLDGVQFVSKQPGNTNQDNPDGPHVNGTSADSSG